MGFSDEWKRILRDELPYYLDARDNNEPFPLVVHPRLIRELDRQSGALTFTPQIVVDNITYNFRVGARFSDHGQQIRAWVLWKTVRDPRPVAEQQKAWIANCVAGWISSPIATVEGDYGSD